MKTGIPSVKTTNSFDLLVRGRSTLASVLLANPLVDDMILPVYPVLPGLGQRFFSGNSDSRERVFVGTTAATTGVFLNTHRRVGFRLSRIAS